MPYRLLLFSACLPLMLQAQKGEIPLSLREASIGMLKVNPTLQIADKAVGIARSERQKLNAFWYPMLNTSGMYVHLSDKVEVRQPLQTYTEPAKELVQQLLPNDVLLPGLLDQLGSYTLTVPLFQRNLTTVDATMSWPLFTGGKRIFATRIGNRMVDWAEVGKQEAAAMLQTELIETYYALRLAIQVVEVREKTYGSLRRHYENARKLEANGMITKAERLFAEVNCQEAKREWEAAKQDKVVAHQALCALLDGEDKTMEILPVSTLFLPKHFPDQSYFMNLLEGNNYTIQKLRLEGMMADNQLRISQSAYLPTIALFGKQTLYAKHLPRNLMPRTVVGVAFTWNLFDGLNREADVRKARLTKEALVLGEEKTEDALEVMVQKLYGELKQAQEEAATLQTTIDMSSELLRIRRKSFGEGMATSTEVVDAEVMLAKVRVAMLMAYYQFDVSLASLCSLCGVPELFWEYYEESCAAK